MNNIVVTGKRKSAIAKATIKEGIGNITINKKPISQLPYLQQLEVNEPLVLTHEILGEIKFDVSVNVKGGGTSSRIEASRLAIARAILKYYNNEELRRTFITYDRNMVVADTRRKETCKPGDSKARARRQTSFR